jgi:16S rRNA G966 N2-methylase RsmD
MSHTQAIADIRTCLDELMYSLVDFRLSFEAPTHLSGFPDFDGLRRVVERLDPIPRTVFRLLRLGESVEHTHVERWLSPRLLDALMRAGLLERVRDAWRTPGLVLVPLEGALFFVSTPPAYPTAERHATVWFDLASQMFAKALPGSLSGARVLDIGSGSGAQAILTALRGASRAVGLEISEYALRVAQINAELNGVGARTTFLHSDGLAALGDGDEFDFVVCNTPYAPLFEGVEPATTLDALGNALIFRMLDPLLAHLSVDASGIIATWRSTGFLGETTQRQRIAARLAAAGFATLAFVERTMEPAEGVLNMIALHTQHYGPDRSGAIVESFRALLSDAAHDVDGFYHQLILFKRGRIEGAAGRETFTLLPQDDAATVLGQGR